MEVFVDFGLFELFAAAGLGALGRAIYRRPIARWIVLTLGIAAPAALLLLITEERLKWLAVLALATGLLNTSIIVSIGRATHPAKS